MPMNTKRRRWLGLEGDWSFDGANATFTPGSAPTDPAHPAGVALSTTQAPSGGSLSARVTLPDNLQDDPAARLLLGYDTGGTPSYYTIGLGGYGFAYVLHECRNNVHRPLRGAGHTSHLEPSATYDIVATIHGQRITLAVDAINVLSEMLPTPLNASQAGVFAYANSAVLFENFQWRTERGKAFVVMEFGEPYDSLYAKVIKPACNSSGFDAERADDVYRPGVVLQDITTALESSDVVIAEITPANANVFYEVGYAHARKTPTVLLAKRDERLPFDVSGYRTIFYDDTIRGKDDVSAALLKHLHNIR